VQNIAQAVSSKASVDIGASWSYQRKKLSHKLQSSAIQSKYHDGNTESIMANAVDSTTYSSESACHRQTGWLKRTLMASSTKKRVSPRRAVIERLEVGTLVIVAGASGAGKSTFLDLLAAGALPASIMEALPPGCAKWLQTTGKKVIGKRARDVALHPARVEGALQHYDLLSPFDTEVESYETDRSLKLANRANRIVVVDIRPGREVLREHLAQRLTFRRVPPFMSRLISRPLALRLGAWLERFPDLHRFTGNALAFRRVRARQRWNDRYVMLRSLYEQDDWLEGWYRRWDNYLISAAGARLDRIIHVTPDDGAPSPAFKLDGISPRNGAITRVG
jgi:hypothetical protein